MNLTTGAWGCLLALFISPVVCVCPCSLPPSLRQSFLAKRGKKEHVMKETDPGVNRTVDPA